MKKLNKIRVFLFALFILIVFNSCTKREHSNPIDPNYTVEQNKQIFTNVSLKGVWILKINEVQQNESAIYMIYDGEGIVNEFGAYNMAIPAGTYSVEDDGNFTGIVTSKFSNEYPFWGKILSDSTLEFTAIIENADTLGPIPAIKVKDESLCQGNWEGPFLRESTEFIKYTRFSINSSGSIDYCSGFQNPVYGKFFFHNTYLVGHFSTGEESNDRKCEIGIKSGNINNVNLSGLFGEDCNGNYTGAFNLNKVSQFTEIDLSGYWSLFHKPENEVEIGAEVWQFNQNGNNITFTYVGDLASNGTGLINDTKLTLSFSDNGTDLVELQGTTDGINMFGSYDNQWGSGTWRGEKIINKGILYGRIDYLGTMGQVDSSHPMVLAIYDENNIQMTGQPVFGIIMDQNHYYFSFPLDLGSFQVIVMFDSNGDGVWDGDGTTPYEIYNDTYSFDGSSLKINILSANNLYNLNMDFDDSHTK